MLNYWWTCIAEAFELPYVITFIVVMAALFFAGNKLYDVKKNVEEVITEVIATPKHTTKDVTYVPNEPLPVYRIGQSSERAMLI